MRPLPRLLCSVTLLFLCAGIAFSTALFANDALGWTVVSSSGEVRVEGQSPPWEPGDGPVAGAPLQTPFTVRTGGDGELVIARGDDRISLGPDGLIEVPEPAAANEGIVSRIRQTMGSALYQVQHRLKAVFEVETPYLVSVVKGTTFNILATADSTTVALIEGRLLVRTPDERAEVMLEAGQAAFRSADDDEITVEDQRKVSAPVRGPVRIGRGNGTATPSTGGLAAAPGDGPLMLARLADHPGPTIDLNDTRLERIPGDGVIPGDDTARLGETGLITGDSGVELALGETTIDIGDASIAGIGPTPALQIGETSANIGGMTLDVSLDSGLDAGLSVGETALDIGGVSLGETGLTPGLDIGGSSLVIGSLDVDVGLESGISLGGTSLDLGGVSLGETGLTPALELGNTTLDIGGIDLDAGLSPSLSLGDTSLRIDEFTIGETALTPEIGLGETSLDIGGSGIALGTEIELGIIDPLEVSLEVDGSTLDNVVEIVDNVVTETTSTVLDPLLGAIGGKLGLF